MLPARSGPIYPGSVEFALTEDEPTVTEDTPQTANQNPPTEQNPPLFYTAPEPLVRTGHKDLKIRPEWDFTFAAKTNTIPITAPEFSLAARHYPIIMLGEDLVPVIAVGLNSQKNLFVGEDGAWEPGSYIPAYARRYPFILIGQQTDERLQMGVDSNAQSDKENARPLFENGEETETIKKALTMSEQFHQAYMFTSEFAKAINEAGIVEERAIEVEAPNGEKTNLGSFKAINEEKFKEVPDATFLEWRKRGFLHSIYFHLQSLNNWDNLIGRGAIKSGANGQGTVNF